MVLIVDNDDVQYVLHMRNKLSRIMRNPTFCICEKQRRRSAAFRTGCLDNRTSLVHMSESLILSLTFVAT